MNPTLPYVQLPSEQTEFEQQHLARMNVVALIFFWCNLPLFTAVAWWNETGPLFAVFLTSLTLFGSTVATMVWRSARTTSVIHGITAMCMGGLLVHLGQGPMQIEMHFYFFSLLAVLAIFGNPMVIVAAAVTVTLHHTVIFALIPDSVFNYDASIWVVAVHAAFVVVESVAAVFLARSYFDNVIGLERIVSERTQELDQANQSMRLVLENVSEGLVTVDRDGRLDRERSSKASEWLGEDQTETPLAERVRSMDTEAADWLEIGWQDLADGIMPMSVTIDQLPKVITRGDQHLKVSYIPIGETVDEFERMLVVLSDVSAEIAQKEAEGKQRQLLALIESVNEDRAGFQAFYEDASELMTLLAEPSLYEHEDVLRWLHTLKGNALSYNMDQLGRAIHALETELSEERRTMSALDYEQLKAHWGEIRDGLGMIVGVQDDGYLRVPTARAAELERAVSSNRESSEVLSILRSIAFEPVEVRLKSVAKQAERIAAKAGLEGLQVVVEHNDVYVPPAAWAPFWSSLGHVVRNAVDHGMESSSERLGMGKSELGTLTLRAEAVDGFVQISVTDDGRGIDWDRIRAKAVDVGLSIGDDDDALVEALFFDGLTTCDSATELSGRGVGMSAVRQACLDCGGSMQVTTSVNVGTTVTFQFPQPQLGSIAA